MNSITSRDAMLGTAVVLAGLWLALLAAVMTFAPEDPVSLWLVLALPLIPPLAHLVIYTVAQAVRGQVLYGMAVSITAILLVTVNFRHRGYGDKGIDLQVLMRLGGILLLLAIGLPHLLRFLRSDLDWVPRLWLSFLLLLVTSSFYAAEPAHALLGSVSFLASFLCGWHFAEVYGRQAFVRMMLICGVMLNAASLVVYFTVPHLGRLPDYINGAWTLTSRMQGVQGTPNGLGLGAAFTILLLVLMLDIRRRGPLFWGSLALFAVCLYLTHNRMSMFGLLVCAVFMFLCHGDFRLRAILVGIAASVAGLAFYLFGELIFSMLSRTGNAEEITTGTGRAGIWSAAVDTWLDHPIMGLGFNSSLVVLQKRGDLFEAAAHTHNMLLEVLFSTGLLGLGFFVAAIVASLKAAADRRRMPEMALIVLFLVYGVTEPVVFGLANFSTLAFFAAMILAFVGERREAEPRPAPVVLLQPQRS